MSNLVQLVLVLAAGIGCSSLPATERAKEGPLKLTPYIETGRIEEARRLAKVTGLKPEVHSYAGVITVDKECDSNLFFWFFPSTSSFENDPVSVWLNGGPGSSSMFGLLTENGPYDLSMDGVLTLREYPWNRNSSVIYVDNPVGVGYSYATGGPRCYSANETHVGENFLRMLEQFFDLFPELKNNPFYLTGESYAGKYIPAIARTILHAKTTVRLTGIAIGNGLIDPINQLHYAENFYQLGLIDTATKRKIEAEEEAIAKLIKAGKFSEAADMRSSMISSSFGNAAGYKVVYNFLLPNGDPRPDFPGFLQSPLARKALHVGDLTWDDGKVVSNMLHADMMQTMKPWLEEVMNHYRVLLYYGQMDMRDGYTASIGFIEDLKFKSSDDYAKAKRKLWYVGNELAGYAKTGGNFTDVLVRNAGHMVPTNQPEWALDMYNRFIFNLGF